MMGLFGAMSGSQVGETDPEYKTFLERSFIFYASYHNDKVNQFIHFIFVWQILFTAFIMLAFTQPVVTEGQIINVGPALLEYFPEILRGNIYTYNWNYVVCCTYFAYYFAIERDGFAGYLCCLLILIGYIGSTYLVQTYGDLAFTWALRVHVLSWLAQFYGHGVHEGRSPALFSNLFQAFAMAPLFVVMEVLFKFGYRPAFRNKCQGEVDKKLAEWAAEKSAAAEKNLASRDKKSK